MYSVVEFKESDGSKSFEAIPSTWIDKSSNSCFYPPPTSAVVTAIEKRKSPKSSWGKFNCTVKYSNDELKKVRRKRNVYADTSNVESSEDENQMFTKRVRLENRTTCAENMERANPMEDIIESGLASHQYIINRSEVPMHSPPIPSLVLVSSGNMSTAAVIEKNIEPNQSAGTCTNEIGEQSKGLLTVILRKLEYLKKDNEEIKVLLHNLIDNKLPDPAGLEMTFSNFPLKSSESVFELEELINSDPEEKAKLVSFLSKVGGKTSKACTGSVMGRLIENSVAINYNWAGTKRGEKTKIPFKKSALVPVVYASVRAHFPHTTEDEMDSYMKTWLRYSKSRLGSNNLLDPLK